MIVFVYFFEKMDLFVPLINRKEMVRYRFVYCENFIFEFLQGEAQRNALAHHHGIPVPVTPSSSVTCLTYSLILAVSVCYHARLSDRTEFEQKVAHEFTAPLRLSGGAVEFQNIIRW